MLTTTADHVVRLQYDSIGSSAKDDICTVLYVPELWASSQGFDFDKVRELKSAEQ